MLPHLLELQCLDFLSALHNVLIVVRERGNYLVEFNNF